MAHHMSADNTTSSDNGVDSNRDAVDVTKDVIIIFLLGVVFIVILTVSVYLIAMVLDRLCCCCPDYSDVWESMSIDRGPVSRKAGLYGLSVVERQQVLRRVFDDETVYKEKAEAEDDLEAAAPEKETQVEGNVRSTERNEELNDDPLNDEDHEKSCAICLNRYAEGDRILKGLLCSHVFHYECAMEWLEKRHDHCPYCRKEMMTGSAMRAAAVEVLGQARVTELSTPTWYAPTDEDDEQTTDMETIQRNDNNDVTGAVDSLDQAVDQAPAERSDLDPGVAVSREENAEDDRMELYEPKEGVDTDTGDFGLSAKCGLTLNQQQEITKEENLDIEKGDIDPSEEEGVLSESDDAPRDVEALEQRNSLDKLAKEI